MYSKYLHLAGGFGGHKGKQIDRPLDIALATFKKYLPGYKILLHTLPGTYNNVPSSIERIEYDEAAVINSWPNFKLIRGEHMADAVRLKAMQKYGGLASDFGDQWLIAQPDFSKLYNKDIAWMARWSISTSHLLCGFFFAGKPHATFIEHWIAEYNRAESLGGWQDLSCFLPSKLAKQYPELIDTQLYDGPYGKSPFYEHGSIRRKDLDCNEPWPSVSGKGIMVHCSFRGQREPVGAKYAGLLDWLEREHC